jgi:hypothetical protein
MILYNIDSPAGGGGTPNSTGQGNAAVAVVAPQAPVSPPQSSPPPQASPPPSQGSNVIQHKFDSLAANAKPPEGQNITFKYVDPDADSFEPVVTGVVKDNVTNPPAAPNAPAPVTPAPVATPVATVPAPVTPAPNQPLVTLPTLPRDYTGYSPEEQNYLKQMSNESFNWVDKQIKESKKMAGSSVLQHPQGYILSPQYQQLNEEAHYKKTEAIIHQQNLAAINEGKDWTPLRGFDKSGNPVFDVARKATSQDAENVRLLSFQALQQHAQYEQALNNMSTNYRQQVAAADSAIQQQRASLFSWASNPEAMNTPIKFNGKDTPLREVHSHITKMLPSHYQNLATTPIIGDLWVWNTMLRNENDELKQKQSVVTTQVKEAGRVEPTSTNGAPPAPATNPYGGPAVFSAKGMEDL